MRPCRLSLARSTYRYTFEQKFLWMNLKMEFLRHDAFNYILYRNYLYLKFIVNFFHIDVIMSLENGIKIKCDALILVLLFYYWDHWNIYFVIQFTWISWIVNNLDSFSASIWRKFHTHHLPTRKGTLKNYLQFKYLLSKKMVKFK